VKRHIYRIEAPLLKTYFEKYCLEMYEDPLVSTEDNQKPTDPSLFRKEPNYMLQVKIYFAIGFF
jgi:hypothetical protein